MTAELFTGELEETKKFKNKPTAVFDEEIQKPPSPNGKSPDIGEKVSLATPTVRSPMDTSPSSSHPKDLVEISKEDQLKYTKAEIDQVKKENEILRTMLAQIIKDYQSLQMHFFYIVQQEEAKETVESTPAPKEVEEPDQLVSLSLGSSSSGHKKQDRNNTSKGKDVEKNEEGLTLRLECKYDGCSSSLQGSKMSPENIFEEPKEEEEEHGNPWPPRKMLKNLRNGDDEVLQQLQVEKARVCMRTRCNAPTMNDGCLWRKYGQKIAKANPYPRAYYRCTVAPGCPVRKKVQRCAEDRSILITAYEGTHNHSLPVSATAMASTTSAAACMLLSSSSTSQLTTISPASLTTIANANLHGLTFGLSDISRQRQLYLPNPSVSSNTSRPTVTLDLTAPRSSTSQANQFNWLSSSFNTAPRYSSTSLNSSSSDYSNTMPTTWRSGNLSYGSSNKNSSTVSLNLGRQLSLESFCQSYLQKATNLNSSTANEHGVTKGIEMDPSFQSSLAAAVSSLSTSTRFLHAPQR